MKNIHHQLRKLPGVLGNVVALLLVSAVAFGGLLVWLINPMPLQNLRLSQFDQLQRWYPRVYEPASVRVVDIDEASLQAHGQWPWPRTRLAELVDRLQAAGAAVVVFDVLLVEPDRTSPESMARLWNRPRVSQALAILPDHDTVLQRSLSRQAVVLGTNLSASPPIAGQALGPDKTSLPFRVVQSGAANATQWLTGFDSVVWPLPALRDAAQGLGGLNFSSDGDGVVRRVPLMYKVGNEMLPSLSAEALRVAQGARNYLLRSTDAGVQDLRIGAVTATTNARAELWLHYTEPRSERFVSAARVLAGQADPALLDGHIVLVGSSAAGLMDLRFSPMGQVMPGVLAHALALEQMLLGHELNRPAWIGGLEATLILVLGLSAGLFSLAASARAVAVVLVLVMGGLLGAGIYAFTELHLLLDTLSPALVVFMSFALGSSIHHWLSEREQRWIRNAFSRYVSPNRVAHLVAHRDQLELGGQRQVCSFVFTDLAGFTSMMEAGDPEQAVTQLNAYLDGLLAIVFKHEGTLDRIVGDATAVLFSAPVIQADHCQRALNCALEMNQFACQFATRQRGTGLAWGCTRIGVHTGEVIVGNFGGKTLFDYRALGDPINTASRLESVNKHLGTRICVSKAILDACSDVAARRVGRLVLKGKVLPLTVYEPITPEDSHLRAPAEDYAAAIKLLCPQETELTMGTEDSTLALAQFEQLAQRFPQDPLVALHRGRLRSGAQDDLIVMGDK